MFSGLVGWWWYWLFFGLVGGYGCGDGDSGGCIVNDVKILRLGVGGQSYSCCC